MSMWKTFQSNDQLYMIKVENDETLILYLSDMINIWSQNLPKENVLNLFQEVNPLFDIKVEEAVDQVINLISHIGEAETVVTKTYIDKIHLTIKSTKAEIEIKFKCELEMLSPEHFLKEVTVPLIQTVKHLEEQQKMLWNLLGRKDRELEEYKLEKGVISRDDLVTENFDENSFKCMNAAPMVNVFGTSKQFWDTFVEQHGDLTVTVENIQKDPWNHVKRKRKVYSSKTVIKKGKGIDYNETT